MEIRISACKCKLISYTNVTFVDETTKLLKETVSFTMSVRLSVYPSLGP